mmetsp:Transcript_4144/g.11747  ORF Transcript_4144/g.11747 Transcript_4144/m.11747 type:complete len:250 (-) Transcript_4144:179-928(-)
MMIIWLLWPSHTLMNTLHKICLDATLIIRCVSSGSTIIGSAVVIIFPGETLLSIVFFLINTKEVRLAPPSFGNGRPHLSIVHHIPHPQFRGRKLLIAVTRALFDMSCFSEQHGISNRRAQVTAAIWAIEENFDMHVTIAGLAVVILRAGNERLRTADAEVIAAGIRALKRMTNVTIIHQIETYRTVSLRHRHFILSRQRTVSLSLSLSPSLSLNLRHLIISRLRHNWCHYLFVGRRLNVRGDPSSQYHW